MFTAKIQNKYGESLELTHNSDYTVVSIDGLAPAAATINTAVMATSDGEFELYLPANDKNVSLLERLASSC